MPTWVWFVIGSAFLIAEMFVPTGFYLFILGLSAIIIAIISFIGLAQLLWLQVFLFIVLAFLLVYIVKKRFSTELNTPLISDILGKEVEILTQIEPNQIGQGILRGSPWQVRNGSEKVLQIGEKVLVQRVEGLTLVVN